MNTDFHSVILNYTFVDNNELSNLFLSRIKETYSGLTIQLNESVYVIKSIDYINITKKVKEIYSDCIKQYPSKGDDYVSILYSGKLACYHETSKIDRIVEQHIIGTKYPL